MTRGGDADSCGAARSVQMRRIIHRCEGRREEGHGAVVIGETASYLIADGRPFCVRLLKPSTTVCYLR